jgi:tetratricopeptide (TPR) repeat protein
LAIDREGTLKKAEKLLRQGKLDAAIAEYLRIVEEQPRDWNTRNALGDLYVRAAKADKAAAQYSLIAEHLTREGFFPRAAALFKKILKIKPDDETVQLNLGELSAKQGLLADAKGYFTAVANRRRTRGDRTGADEIIVRLGALDPSDFDARVMAARTLAQNGEAIAAAMQFRSMYADLRDRGRATEALAALREAVRYNHDDIEGRAEIARTAVAAGDLDTARMYLDRKSAGDDPALLMALMEVELRAGHMDQVRELLREQLHNGLAQRTRIVEMAWTLAADSPAAAFACIDVTVEAELGAGNYMDAAAILQEFVTRVPGQIASLLKLVEICVDGGLEAIMYETQAQLADAYLESGQAAEARVIAEDLVAREPWEHAHIERFRRALVMMNVPDPDTVIADRLAGQGPFIATDPFMAPESFGEPEPPLLRPWTVVGPKPVAPAAPAQEPRAQDPPSVSSSAPPPASSSAPPAASPSAPPSAPPPPSVSPSAPPPASSSAPPSAPPASSQPKAPSLRRTPGKGARVDADLTNVLDQLQGMASPKPAGKGASDHLAAARSYLKMGMQEEAITALQTASRVPLQRFEAAALLGRLYLERNDLPHAIEWLGRAAEAPAPSEEEGRELLYDLGCILETAGETARALAVFLELQVDAGEYRDVAARVDRLARVQTGG